MKPINLYSIGLASDHAGYALKGVIQKKLEEAGVSVYDYGCNSEESCDYPDYAHPLAEAVEKGACDFGISICGSGNGIQMTANKHQQVRAALCWIPEIASLARKHNNANILSLPARFVTTDEALKMVDVFFSTDFEGGRHQRRIDKIPVEALVEKGEKD